VLGLLNAIVRPVLRFLSLPITILTLGLFALVINALMFWLMSPASSACRSATADPSMACIQHHLLDHLGDHPVGSAPLFVARALAEAGARDA
jgi:hypothetical protein